MELRSSRSRSRTPFVQTKLEMQEIVTNNQENHVIEETVVKHSYSTRNKTVKSNSSASDEIFESSAITTKKSPKVVTRSRHKTSDYSSEECENEISSSKGNGHARSRASVEKNNGDSKSALQVYKEAGEYWNKYPKTDYTYSIHSRDRVELAPGVVAMPNMSRRSLRRSTESTAPLPAEYKSNYYSADATRVKSDYRYDHNTNIARKNLFQDLDSDGEFEYSEKVEEVSIFRRFYQSFTSIITRIVTSVIIFLTTVSRTSAEPIVWAGRSYYRAVSRLLLFDTWLLQSSSGNRRWGPLIALMLLPLLIFTGWWLWSGISHILQEGYIIPTSSSAATSQIEEEEIAKIISTPPQNTPTEQININELITLILSNPKFENIINKHIHNKILIFEQPQKSFNLLEAKVNDLNQKIDTLAANLRHSIFLAKQDLESKLSNLSIHMHADFEKLVEISAAKIMNDVTDKINLKLKERLEINHNSIGVDSALTDSQIHRIVKEALAVYDADKTGLVDYALEPSGGQILSTRCTESYNKRTAVLSVLGFPLWYPSNTPRTVITPGVVPGECWAFQNFPGFLIIQLSAFVEISAVSVEHIPKSLQPGGVRDSAPKKFTVLGLQSENDREPWEYGSYVYDLEGPALQFFKIQNEGPPVNMVELRVESNHGNLNYTCLYRFRVHGTLSTEPT